MLSASLLKNQTYPMEPQALRPAKPGPRSMHRSRFAAALAWTLAATLLAGALLLAAAPALAQAPPTPSPFYYEEDIRFGDPRNDSPNDPRQRRSDDGYEERYDPYQEEFTPEDEEDPFLREDNLEEDGFVEEDPNDFGLPPAESGIDLQPPIAEERALLPQNIAWGAATGLVLGGWFALIFNSDSRTTQRYIGSGIVFGSLIGLLVGTRSIYQPAASDTNGYGLAPTPPLRSARFPVLALNWRW